MTLRLCDLFAAATSLFYLILTAAAASSILNVSVALSNVPRPHANSATIGAMVHNVTDGYHNHAYGTVSLSDTVHVADDRYPDEDKTKALKWQGKATLEINMFSNVVNTCGNLTGPLIYGTVWQTLNDQCPTRIGNNDLPSCGDGYIPIPIRRKRTDGGWEASLCQLRIISSKFGNARVHREMFGALAATYEAQTSNDMNCYSVKDDEYNNRYCNTAYQASVFTEDSNIYMSLTSDWSRVEHADKRSGDWRCCETREYVDSKLDAGGDVQRFKDIYPTPRSKGRNVECHRGCTNDQRMSSVDIDKRLVHVMDMEEFQCRGCDRR